jgi:hypothetical protein
VPPGPPPHPRPPPPPPHPYPDHWHYSWDTGAAIAAGVAVGAAAAYAAGSVVYALPVGCVEEVVGGVSYWNCSGVWYRPSFVGTDIAYVVVPAP